MVPNRNIWGGNIVNYSAMETRRVDLVVGISYGADIQHAQKTIESVVTAHELVHADPAPDDRDPHERAVADGDPDDEAAHRAA